METSPSQKYTKDYREQAVKLVIEHHQTIPQAARQLAMSAKTLMNWVHQVRHGKWARVDDYRRPVTDLESEVSKLKRELAEARMERDVLKKATAYFAKESR